MEQELSNNDKADAEERDHKTDKAMEEVSTEEASPPAPEPLFQQYGFKNMPGVALIVPDQTPPAELIRIAATVVEEISLMVLRKTAAALLG